MGVVAVFAVGVAVGLLVNSGGSGGATTVTAIADESAAEVAQDGERAEESTPTTDAEGELTDCDEAGISAPPRREGTCETEGQKAVVVDQGSTLKLKELKVKLLGIDQAKTVASEYGDAKSASGTYVIFTLEVTNRTSAPVYFDSNQSQVFLYIGGNVYTEDFDVENYSLDDSFVDQFKQIQPKGSQVGTVAFDVPDSVLPGLTKSGNLDIVNFSEEEAGLNAGEVGTIRTYQ